VSRRSNENSRAEAASRPGRGGDKGLGMPEGAEERESHVESMVCEMREWEKKGSKNSLKV
jgi:hypothetical protein